MTGLAVTLAVVGGFSWYALHQIAGLRDLQTQLVDRNRKDSLQLLRIQNNLNLLGLDMRDMVNGDEPYGLEAYRVQFTRIRADLEDALRLEKGFAPVERSPERQAYFAERLTQFWTSVDQMFSLAAGGKDAQARSLIRGSLESQQAAITTTVARLLVQNNESEEGAAARIQAIYAGVERNVYYFLGAALITIVLTSGYLIRANRRLFEELASLSTQRSDLARKLISMQEEVLRSISRELHDEFGQILTAIGAMLMRARQTAGLAAHLPREHAGSSRDYAGHAGEDAQSVSVAPPGHSGRWRSRAGVCLVSAGFRTANGNQSAIPEDRTESGGLRWCRDSRVPRPAGVFEQPGETFEVVAGLGAPGVFAGPFAPGGGRPGRRVARRTERRGAARHWHGGHA